MKQLLARNRILTVYLIMTAALYAAILYGMASMPYSSYSKIMYAAVTTNFFVIMLLYHNRVKKERKCTAEESLVPAALTVTLIADWFLVFADRWPLAGVLCFCVVQSIYSIHLKAEKRGILLRIILFSAFVFILLLLRQLSPLNVSAALSFALLTGNVRDSFARCLAKMDAVATYFFEGMVLFWGCDLSLGLREITAVLPGIAMSRLHMIFFYLIWICYVPSQAAIILSYASESAD